MSNGYVRQSSFVDGDIVSATIFNSEYDQLELFASESLGHAHDGSVGQGPVIDRIGDAGSTTPKNKIIVDSDNNRACFFINVANSAVEQIRLEDGLFKPVTDADVDLGDASHRFKDIRSSGISYLNRLQLDKTITTAGTTGNQTINKPMGSVNMAAGDTTVTVTNNLVDVNSVILVTLDNRIGYSGYHYRWQVNSSSGAFVIRTDTYATAELRFNFLVLN